MSKRVNVKNKQRKVCRERAKKNIWMKREKVFKERERRRLKKGVDVGERGDGENDPSFSRFFDVEPEVFEEVEDVDGVAFI